MRQLALTVTPHSPYPASLQRMKPVGMDVHVLNHLSLVQPRQNRPDSIHHVSRQLPGIILLEKPFKPTVLETSYHLLTVVRSAPRVKLILLALGRLECSLRPLE